MSIEKKVVAFKNCNDYPVSYDIRGLRGKVVLYEGQVIRDREGNPIIPMESEWAWLIQRGVKPVYQDVEVPEIIKSQVPMEVVMDEVKLLEAKVVAKQESPFGDFASPKTVEPADEDEVAPVSHLERKENPDPEKPNLVWQDGSGVWILNKDGYSNSNPAALKMHVRMSKGLGKDFLDMLEWRPFGGEIKEND
jgi:hypothetical protein